MELDFFKALINQSNDAIFVIKPETGRFLYVNEKACRSLGCSADELMALKIHDIADAAESGKAWLEQVGKAEKTGRAVFETEYRRKDGSRFPVEVSTGFLSHEGEEFMISIVRDISERRRAAAELLAEKNKLESVVSALGDGLTVQNTEYRIIYQNDIQKEKQGEHVGEFCYKAYQNRDGVCPGCVLRKCFEDGRIHRRETTARNGDKVLHLEVSACPLHDAGGKIVAGVEVVRDITLRKHLEKELRHAQKMEAIGTLAGGIAHDFNNILSAMLGNAELAMRKLPAEEPAQAHLAEVVRAGKRAADLVRQVLAFNRKGEQERLVVNFQDVIDEVLRLLCITAPPSVEIRRFVDDRCRPVFADTSQMHQLIMNLVVNAFHAMDEQGGTLEIGLEEVEFGPDATTMVPVLPQGVYARLSVRDTGCGMDKLTVERIFDPYFTTKEVGNGTGLGLSSVHGIVKGHGGHIKVESEPGLGTCFIVYLPLHGGEVEEQGKTAADYANPLLLAKILFVDDEEMLVRLAQTALEELGCRVTALTDSCEALELFAADPAAFDLIITDQSMPGLTGTELARKMLAIRPDLPVVLCTGYAENVSRDLEKGEGIGEVAMKPLSLDDFSRIIRRAVAGGETFGRSH